MGCMFFSIYLGLVISVKHWVMIVSGRINSRVSSLFLWKWQWVFRVEGNKDNFVIHHFSTGGRSYRKKGKETEGREEIYTIIYYILYTHEYMPYNLYNTEDNLFDHDRIDLFFWVHNLDRSQTFFISQTHKWKLFSKKTVMSLSRSII